MPKYRLLTQEELHELEKEFIDYLIVNSITADDWEKMKQEENEKANHILDLFSDVVMEGVLRKVKFLEYRDRTEVKTYQCLDDKFILVGMTASAVEKVDFTDHAFVEKSMKNPPSSLKVYTSEKKYTNERELEILEMTQAGREISDGKLFKTLCLALPAASRAIS